MQKFYTITIFFSGSDKRQVYKHVPSLYLEFGSRVPFVKFKDKDNLQHYVVNAVVTVDEESPNNAESALSSDVL